MINNELVFREGLLYIVPNRLVSDDGHKHVFQNDLVSVQVSKWIMDTDESRDVFVSPQQRWFYRTGRL